MKNQNHSIFSKCAVVLSVLLFTVACEEDFVIDTDNFEPKLVVNSIFNPEASWKVKVTKSKNVLDPQSQIEPIRTAIVSVYNIDGSLFAEFDHKVDGLYLIRNDKRAEYEQTYVLEVTAEGYKRVMATSSVPKPVKIDEVMISESVNAENVTEIQVDFKLIDEDDESNYYVWELARDKFKIPYPLLDNHDQNILLSSTDTNTETIVADKSLQRRIFLTDMHFQKNNHSTSFTAFENQPSPIPQLNDGIIYEDINLVVMTVSKELFEYYKSVELYNLLEDSANSSVSQPVHIFSNIQNGLGIFAGFSETVVKIK